MATLTEAQLQSALHTLYEKNTSTPDETSSDYLVRRGLLNTAIEKWGDKAQSDNMRWRQLFTTGSITTNGTSTVSLPSDFIEPASLLKITETTGDVYYDFVSPEKVLSTLRDDSSSYIYHITGSPGSYTLNINPTPATGKTGTITYYKSPTLLSSTSSVTEIPKPYFLIYDALSALFEEERPDLSNKYLQMAADLMKAMVIDNDLLPQDADNTINSPSMEYRGVVFGK